MQEQFSPRAKDLLTEIGLKLRAAREAMGVSLNDVALQTRINKSFLEKLEVGDTNGLPGLAFVRGFVRNYIEVLGLEDPELEKEIQSLSAANAEEKPQKLSPPSQPELGIFSEIPVKNLAVVAMSALAVVLVIFLLYSIFSGDDNQATTQKEAPKVEQAAEPVTQGESKASNVENPAEGQPPAETAPNSQQAGGGNSAAESVAANVLPGRQPSALRLTIRGLEPAWIRISVDRAPPVDVQVEPAETLEWDANEEIRLTVGKSNAVSIYLNGEDIVLSEGPGRLVPTIVLNKLTLLRLEN